MKRLKHSASNSFMTGNPNKPKAFTELPCLRLLLYNQATPVMSYGCSSSAQAYFCGLMSSQMVSETHKVSVHLEENVFHLLKLSDLFASLNGSGRKNDSLNEKVPSPPADGLCWCGIPPVSYAYCRYNT